MKTYNFTDALGIAKAVFYDLTAKKLRFSFFMSPDLNYMMFTVLENADIIKSCFPQFEIRLDANKNRVAELVINYD